MVCTGNVHRSPLAERLLMARLGQYREAFRVTSAGTAARAGTPMDPVAVALLAGLGGDPHDAVASRLTVELVENADLVLGAATEHRDAAVRLSPVWALRRAFTLREFARLLRAEDAAGVAGPAERAAVLVRGAWARRGRVGRAEDDDVADPYGAPVRWRGGARDGSRSRSNGSPWPYGADPCWGTSMAASGVRAHGRQQRPHQRLAQ